VTLSNFHPGEAVRCYLTSCASSSGGIVDPTPLLFTYWSPSGTGTVATTSGSVITTGGSSGLYYAEVVPTTSEIGRWDYRWSSTGTYKLAQWGAFRVLEPARST
jgi:hypothetical protein